MDYDYFTGEALFYNFLSNNENNELVWRSMQFLAQESPKDTCYIAALINLDNKIRTNVELAESMSDFVVKAILNNLNGFLDIYVERNYNMRTDLLKYISRYDTPNNDLISIFKSISKNSVNEKYRMAANVLLQNINNIVN